MSSYDTRSQSYTPETHAHQSAYYFSFHPIEASSAALSFPIDPRLTAPAPIRSPVDEQPPIAHFDPDFQQLQQPPRQIHPVAGKTNVPPRNARGKAKSKSKSKPKAKSSASSHSTAPLAPIPPNIRLKIPALHPTHSVPKLAPPGRPSFDLLPAPAGACLDVNELLIVHPPSLLPGEEARDYQGEIYASQWEMYTCRVCSKTYAGKNARSVARRHLQDKHNIPLAAQPRRSRWDWSDRPKDSAEARERNLKSKREWAKQNRNRRRQQEETSLGPDTNKSKRKTPSSRTSTPPRVSSSRFNVYTQTPVSNARDDEDDGDREAIRSEWDTLAARESQEVGWTQEQLEELQAISASFSVETDAGAASMDQDNGYLDESGEEDSSLPSSPSTTSEGPEEQNQQWVAPPQPAQWNPRPPPWALSANESSFADARGYDYQGSEYGQQHAVSMPASQAFSSLATLQEESSELTSEMQEYDAGLDEAAEPGEQVELGVAAESLLNLHSTPLRPSPQRPLRDVPPSHSTHLRALDPSLHLTPNDADSATLPRPPAPTWPLLEPPVITPRPRPQRARSLVQPFRNHRQGVGHRSLSFSGLDDPFAFGPIENAHKSGRIKDAAGEAKNGKTDENSSPMGPPPRNPLSGIRINAPDCSMPATLLASMTPDVSNKIANSIATTASITTGTPPTSSLPSSGILSTPLSRRPIPAPSSLSRAWTLSSPGNAEAAAALGLGAHAWYWNPETPGVAGMVQAETPVSGLRGRASRGRADEEGKGSPASR